MNIKQQDFSFVVVVAEREKVSGKRGSAVAGFGCAGGGPVSAAATLVGERGGWSGVGFGACLAAGDATHGAVWLLLCGALLRLVRLSRQVRLQRKVPTIPWLHWL